MEIKLPIKLHNRFDIEVKDITTGKIVQTAQAENIVLSNMFGQKFLSTDSTYTPGNRIMYGSGSGTLSPSRTTLFNQIGYKDSTSVELIANQSPLASYGTHKIVILSNEHVGLTFTEVGIGTSDSTTTIYTHALIKDSEGNTITLGPKTNKQEITIYRTIYFQPNLETGILLIEPLNENGLILAGTMYSQSFIGYTSTNIQYQRKPRLLVGTETYLSPGVPYAPFIYQSLGTYSTGVKRKESDQSNEKIKIIKYAYPGLPATNSISVNLETLAENNSFIWSGWEFDNKQIGVGNGSQTIFNLTWDEAWLAKPYKVYVDGVEKTSGFTFNAGNITFDTAPADQAIITADYWVKYIPKDTDHVIDITFTITFGEGMSA